MMKLKQIALLTAGLLGSSIAFAAPVTIAQIETARAAGQLDQAWITGASAPTRSIYEGWVGSGASVGCDATTNAIFSSQAGTVNTPGALGNYLAYACTRAGKVSVLYVTLDGGSLNAYTPHTKNTKLARLKYLGTTTCPTVVSYVDGTNSDNNATVYKGCTQVGGNLPADNTAALASDPLAPQLPVGGFSDVEAALFDTSIGGGNVSTKGNEGSANVTQAFGIAVSDPLYRAMQSAQGLSDINATTFDPANAPNITKTQYTSIVTAGGLYQSGWAPFVGATAATGKAVIIERRVDTSGTQASSNSFFLNNPCAAGAGGGLGVATSLDNVPGVLTITQNSGSSNVKTRLTAATTANNFAIGVLSLENNWRDDLIASTPVGGYKYIKINGVHPEAGDTANARATMANGTYEFVKELKTFIANTAPVGFGKNIITQITSALSNPPATACAVFPRGLALSPLAGSVCGAAQVTKLTNLGNNCNPVQFAQ